MDWYHHRSRRFIIYGVILERRTCASSPLPRLYYPRQGRASKASCAASRNAANLRRVASKRVISALGAVPINESPKNDIMMNLPAAIETVAIDKRAFFYIIFI